MDQSQKQSNEIPERRDNLPDGRYEITWNGKTFTALIAEDDYPCEGEGNNRMFYTDEDDRLFEGFLLTRAFHTPLIVSPAWREKNPDEKKYTEPGKFKILRRLGAF